MFVDANELSEDPEIACDVCVVGGGPAGTTIAAELGGAGIDVCLIESGGLDRGSEEDASNVAEQIGVPMNMLTLRTHAFGGASNVWGGVRRRWFRSKPMDPIDFETRHWIPNSGWPFPYEELLPWYEQAGEALELASFDAFSPEVHLDQLTPAFHNAELHTTIFQASTPVRFAQRFRDLLAGSPYVRVWLNARVVEIEEDADAPLVRAVRIATLAGRDHRITAKHFVLACGGIENPRLLLVSRRKSRCGIGNGHDLVGRYYMQHPKGRHGIAVIRRPALRTPLYTQRCVKNGVKFIGALAFNRNFQRRERLLNHCLHLFPVHAFSESPASDAFWALYRTVRKRSLDPSVCRRLSELARFGASICRSMVRNPHLGTVFSVANHMEQIPHPERRVELSDTRDRFGVQMLRVRWHIDPSEKESLRRLHQLLQDKLAAEDGCTLESALDPSAGLWPVAADAGHHMGTTRMHADPIRGVVDPDCRIHGLRNLYVTGSSVFPTSGHANPTLTIIALAIRLSARLKKICKADTGTGVASASGAP